MKRKTWFGRMMGRGVLVAVAAAIAVAGMTSTSEAGRRVVVVKPAKKTVVKRTVVRTATPVVVKKTVVHRTVVKKTVVVKPGWTVKAPKVLVRGTPFYYNSTLGFYFGGAAIQLNLGETAPDGYVYYHPFSGKRFGTLAAFGAYCDDHPRQPRRLTVIAV